MKSPVSRRNCLKGLSTGAAALLAHTTVQAQEKNEQKLAIDLGKVDLEGRPMYLRPYHPPYLVYYYAAIHDGKITDKNRLVKWEWLVKRIDNEPDLRIHIIHGYDDACTGCYSLKTDVRGSAWGAGYSCGASPEKVKTVSRYNRRILGDIGLYIDAVLPFREMVALLDENVPVLFDGIGGHQNQEYYEKGLQYLKKKYGLS